MNTDERSVYETERNNQEENTVFENENRTNYDENNVLEEMENHDEAAAEPAKSKKTWGKVAAGFGGGIVMGSLATILTASSLVPNEGESELATEVEVPGLIGDIKVAQGVTDDMSFNEAFAAARAEVGSGGVFVWHGNVYNTYTAEEWNAMTEEQREAFGNNFQSQADNIIDTPTTGNEDGNDSGSVDVNPEGENPSEVEVAEVEAEVTPEVEAEVVAEVTTEFTPEVEVLGFAQDPDSGAMMAGVEIEGQEFVVVDIDNNNEADAVMADLNGDGNISENEIGDISGQGVYMSDLAAMQNNQDLAMGPDYINDADTSIYEA